MWIADKLQEGDIFTAAQAKRVAQVLPEVVPGLDPEVVATKGDLSKLETRLQLAIEKLRFEMRGLLGAQTVLLLGMFAALQAFFR